MFVGIRETFLNFYYLTIGRGAALRRMEAMIRDRSTLPDWSLDLRIAIGYACQLAACNSAPELTPEYLWAALVREERSDDFPLGVSMRFSQAVSRILNVTAVSVRAEGRPEMTCADVLNTMQTQTTPPA